MKLYYNPVSGYSIKALLAFAEGDIKVEKHVVNLMDPEEKAKYREVYPIGKVPLLTLDDGHMVPESSILIEYIDQKFSLGLFPKDPETCRKARFFDRMNDLYLHNQMGLMFFDQFKPEDKRNPDGVAEAKRLIDLSYGKLNHLLAESTYMVGEEYTIADMSLFAALFHAPHTYPYEKHENLVRFVNRMHERAATQKVMQEIEPAIKAFKTKMTS